MFPLVDVLIPVYNAEKFLNKCLDSVKNQSYKNLRILIINDGSTDSSLKIIEEFAASEPRAQVITQNNKGIGATRNLALDNLKGEYFYFLDSDDYIDTNTIESLVNKALDTTADVVISGQAGSDEFRPILTIDKDLIDITDKNEFFNTYVFDNKLYYGVAGKLYSCKAVGSLRFDPRYNFAEDLIFNLCFYTFSHKVALVKDEHYFYCENSDSVTRKKNIDRCYQQFNAFKAFCIFLSNCNKLEEYKIIAAQLYWMCIIRGINLSVYEGASFDYITEFLQKAIDDETAAALGNKVINQGAKTWMNIEAKKFTSKLKIHFIIFCIKRKMFGLLKFFM